VVVDNLTRTQIVQYAGASGDYNPLHTDEVFATQVAGYPSVFAHGMLTMGMTGRMLTDYVGDGRLTEFGGRFTSQVWPGDTLTATATVTAVEERDGVLIADVVYDPVGGDAYQRSTKCIAFEGRILVIGFAGGQIQSAALNHALVKNYSIVGLHWGLYAKMNPALMRVCHDELSRLAADGAIKPLVSERLALEEVADGLQRLADGTTVGRVVFVS
jgi:acyl dehydratase